MEKKSFNAEVLLLHVKDLKEFVMAQLDDNYSNWTNRQYKYSQQLSQLSDAERSLLKVSAKLSIPVDMTDVRKKVRSDNQDAFQKTGVGIQKVPNILKRVETLKKQVLKD